MRARVEVDAGLALDERGGDLEDDRFDAVGARPALFGEQLHADGAARQHVAAFDHRVDHPNEWRLEWEIILYDIKILELVFIFI